MGHDDVTPEDQEPQFAGWLRKNFWPPQSPRYDIGSLQAEVPSMNEYEWSSP